MKKTAFLSVLLLFPAALSAQSAALAQLGALAAVKAAGALQLPEPPAASQDKSTLLPDPRTGRTKPDGLTGKWLGWGEWTYQGSGAHCNMNLEFEDTKDYLLRKGGYFDCGFVGLASEPAKFAKKGAQLIAEDGQAAGSYEGGVITLNENYSENVGIVTTIKVDGLHFDYSEIWTEKSGKEIYVITGRLFTGG